MNQSEKRNQFRKLFWIKLAKTFSKNYYNNTLYCINYIIVLLIINTLYFASEKVSCNLKCQRTNLLLFKHVHELPFGYFLTHRKKQTSKKSIVQTRMQLRFSEVCDFVDPLENENSINPLLRHISFRQWIK